ncbi:hypothetical protein B9Z19DRAFT_1132437 [Tuber borchii]|uniref:Integrase catalytic domain-containing protein n=1 Tax=Tuber borchii TaxID=42251 RepID=A0A2T6ZH78_TUBBO|nr:hypothetical protein B9Z19DRAFT_1132437 [Tuber borchii]
MRENCVRHFPASKTHPSSVGLSERYVQILMTALRATMQDKPNMIDQWDLFMPSVIYSMNTRLLRLHSYTPSELLFGFNPRGGGLSGTITLQDYLVTAVLAAILQENPSILEAPDTIPSIEYNSPLARLDEQRALALDKLSSDADYRARTEGQWESLQNGDLVLLRHFEVDRHKGQKFDARWEGPYRLTDLAWHKQSG